VTCGVQLVTRVTRLLGASPAQPAREFDGGRYSAVLSGPEGPLAAATFNVFGQDAQVRCRSHPTSV
jgi:hypothetical protein